MNRGLLIALRGMQTAAAGPKKINKNRREQWMRGMAGHRNF